MWKETGKTGQRFLAEGQTRAKARRWGGPEKWPSRTEEASQAGLQLCGLGAGLMGTVGRKNERKGANVMNGLAGSEAAGEAGSQGGGFPIPMSSPDPQ